MTDDPEDIKRRLRSPLTDREKEALLRLGFDPDAPQMSDAEWTEWVGAHNAVVRRKGRGVPIGKGGARKSLSVAEWTACSVTRQGRGDALKHDR